MKEYSITNLDLHSSNSLILMVLLTFLGSWKVLSGMLIDFFKGVTQVNFSQSLALLACGLVVVQT